jgi:chromate reductase
MPTQPRLLVFSGSLRQNSCNHALALIASNGAHAAGADLTVLRLADHPLPIYNQDIEERDGLPDEARRLKALFREHDGFIIGCPEYNSTFTAAFKNVVDWVSRPEEGYPPLDGFKGKAAGLVSCSPGRLGGIKVLPTVRMMLTNIGVMVVPDQAAVPHIHECLADGVLTDETIQAAVEGVGRAVADMATHLKH